MKEENEMLVYLQIFERLIYIYIYMYMAPNVTSFCVGVKLGFLTCKEQKS